MLSQAEHTSCEALSVVFVPLLPYAQKGYKLSILLAKPLKINVYRKGH